MTATTNSPLPARTYTPESPLAHPAKLWREMKQDLWAGRELAWRLAVRDISAQYRQSALGVLWALIIPLANTAVWLFSPARPWAGKSRSPLRAGRAR